MKSRNILVVDDEPEVLSMTKSIFEHAGYTQITGISSGKDALNIISAKMPDMVILDVTMPDMDGFEVLQEIRAVSKVPVLMLTARGEAEDKFSGFELGADDYLIKPFLPKELLLRTAAILKRVYPKNNRKIVLDASTIDLDKAEVHRDGNAFSLTAKEYSIFLKLSENAGKIVTIGALCQTVCGEIWHGYESTLMTHIRHLRKKIEKDPSAPVSLLTVKGLGYRLITKGDDNLE